MIGSNMQAPALQTVSFGVQFREVIHADLRSLLMP